MRDREGKPVDMGHVATSLDWQINNRGSTLGLDSNTISIAGDIASAITRNPSQGANGATADAALAGEGAGDLNGDLDGQNLAHRLHDNPNQSISDVLKGYYETPASRNRVSEWLGHSPYVERDSNGAPALDSTGAPKLNHTLNDDANAFARLLTLGGAKPGDFNDQGVVDAFARYLRDNR